MTIPATVKGYVATWSVYVPGSYGARGYNTEVKTFHEREEEVKQRIKLSTSGAIVGYHYGEYPTCCLCRVPERDDKGEPIEGTSKLTVLFDKEKRKEFCGLFYCLSCNEKIRRKTQAMFAKVSFKAFRRAWTAFARKTKGK